MVAFTAVKVTDPPLQNVVAPLGVMVGVGNGFTVIVIILEVAGLPVTQVALEVMTTEISLLLGKEDVV